MAKAQAQEPSMEEILASIRRIIADEDKPKAAPAPEPESHVSEDDLDRLFGGGDETEDTADEDVLELTEEAIEQPADDDFDAIDLAFSEPEAEAEPEPEPESDFDAEPEPEPAPAPVFAAAPAPRREPEPEPVMAVHEAGSLLSAATNHAVASAFGALSGSMATHRGGRTIEDLMQDMLRPMLAQWLDSNLPPLVERLVKAEIERIARGGR